jgi:arabinofuranosyltransferase
VGIGVYTIVLFRTAWITDDAFFTLRTIDNFVNGLGLSWSASERVQSYTHPLWLFVLAAPYAVTREPFYTTLAVSMALSLATVVLIAFFAARSFGYGLVAVCILTLSKAFMDYSTSGLENPLSHLLTALFLIILLRKEESLRTLALLSSIAGLEMLNRLDTGLLFIPTLLVLAWQRRSHRSLFALSLAVLPALIWTGFSLFYYGFPFPNTAYAKLNAGLPQSEYLAKGMAYIQDVFVYDPITPMALLTGIAAVFVTRAWRYAPIAIGILAYIAYIVWIGGDFMTGRFFSTPLVAAVALIVGLPVRRRAVHWSIPFVGFAALGLFTQPMPAILSNARYGLDHRDRIIRPTGIADERAFYYPDTGLTPALLGGRGPQVHPWALGGQYLRNTGKRLGAWYALGMYSYYAGPNPCILDTLALTDVLLARLPLRKGGAWRVGHLARDLPDGHVRTCLSGKNQIADPGLARLYDRLRHITSGPLWDGARLAEIWNMNTGKYATLIQPGYYRRPRTDFAIDEVADYAREIPMSGVTVFLGRIVADAEIAIDLDRDNDYQVILMRQDAEVARQKLSSSPDAKQERLANHHVRFDPTSIAAGYDSIRIVPSTERGARLIGPIRVD